MYKRTVAVVESGFFVGFVTGFAPGEGDQPHGLYRSYIQQRKRVRKHEKGFCARDFQFLLFVKMSSNGSSINLRCGHSLRYETKYKSFLCTEVGKISNNDSVR